MSYSGGGCNHEITRTQDEYRRFAVMFRAFSWSVPFLFARLSDQEKGQPMAQWCPNFGFSLRILRDLSVSAVN